jgi:hypothetical protein
MTHPDFDKTDEFANLVLSQVGKAANFVPQVHTSEDGDCIEFIVSDDDYYAERIDSFVTVYYSRRTKAIIGSIIKGVKRYMREVLLRTPGFKVEIRQGRVKLDRLFTAHLWTIDDGGRDNVITYVRLRDLAEQEQIEAELCPTACDD